MRGPYIDNVQGTQFSQRSTTIRGTPRTKLTTTNQTTSLNLEMVRVRRKHRQSRTGTQHIRNFHNMQTQKTLLSTRKTSLKELSNAKLSKAKHNLGLNSGGNPAEILAAIRDIC